jgi:hypothetical protein
MVETFDIAKGVPWKWKGRSEMRIVEEVKL